MRRKFTKLPSNYVKADSNLDLDAVYKITYRYGKNGATSSIERKGLIKGLNYITEWCYENDQQAVILKIEQIEDDGGWV